MWWQWLKGSLNREMETMKKMQILELKRAVTEMKIPLDGLTSKIWDDRRISDLENRLIEMIHSKDQQELSLTKNK